MTLSGYIPDLLEKDFDPLVTKALEKANLKKENIAHWCMHPGGKRILDAIYRSLQFQNGELRYGYETLKEIGNVSSATILFTLQKFMQNNLKPGQKLFAAAFGPGLTMETFVASCI
jgi:predicted naringenin-chalcone synthase